MDFQQGFNRSQLMMLDFESMVSSDSWARIVDSFVSILPLENLGLNDFAKDTRTAFPFQGGENSGLKRVYDYLFNIKKVSFYKKIKAF